MPWTRRQVKFLESSGSPLTAPQKDKMNSELHQNPALGHEKKGSAAMKKPPEAAGHNYMRTEIEHHRDEGGKITGHTVKHFPMPTSTKSGAFMDRGEPSTHLFGPKGEAVDGGKSMGAHLKEHLGIGAAPSPKTEEAELEPSEKTGGHEEGEYESDEEGT